MLKVPEMIQKRENRRRGIIVDQLVVDGVKGQLRVFHAHFVQNAGAVGADGFHAQTQFVGDVGNGLPKPASS